MTVYVALLRGVNLGKRQLKSDDLRAIGTKVGLHDCRTYVASGNLLFRSDDPPSQIQERLEAALGDHMDAAVPVVLRTAAEMADVAKNNPFPQEAGNKVAVYFFGAAADSAGAKNQTSERIVAAPRELYVHYPDGIGASKLSIPAARSATARNMNTVAKLAELAREIA